MSEQLELYSNTERKSDLLNRLAKILDEQMNAANVLDAKAWELFKVSSATFGLVSALQITITGGDVKTAFWGVLAIVFTLYIIQSILVIITVKPMTWWQVPGVAADQKLLFHTFLKKYMVEFDFQAGRWVYLDDSRYLDQLLTDYLGMEDRDDPTKTKKGAIEVAQQNNKLKSILITISSGLLAAIVAGLVIMAIVAVGNAPVPVP
jgi:hypothetical protein